MEQPNMLFEATVVCKFSPPNSIGEVNFCGEETICSTGELVTCIIAHAVVLFLS